MNKCSYRITGELSFVHFSEFERLKNVYFQRF